MSFFAAKSAFIAARPHEVRLTRQVARALDLTPVPGLGRRDGRGLLANALGYLGRPHRSSGTDEVWAVSVVRDEADVIAYTVEHLVAEGVDRVVVADSGSVDGTREVLAELAEDLPVTVVDDRLRAHHQGVKMTRLARAAARAGATWVIPFDADELWCSPSDASLADTLRRSPLDVAVALLWNHVPGPDDDPDEPNPYLRLRARSVQPEPVVKVAFRAHPWARVVPGNHNVRRPTRSRGKVLDIRHVPWRTPDQIVRKHSNGRQALRAGGIPTSFGSHWHELGGLAPDAVVARIDEAVGDLATVVDPAPFRSVPGVASSCSIR